MDSAAESRRRAVDKAARESFAAMAANGGVQAAMNVQPPGAGNGERLPSGAENPHVETVAIAYRRDRLLAALTLMAGIGLFLALPFALRAGAEFFLPVTAGLVIAIALVPLLEWLERRRVPSSLAALLCVGFFLTLANIAVVSILLPATDWFALLPDRISRIRMTLSPLIEIYASIEQFIDQTAALLARHPGATPRTIALEAPNSLLGLVAASAPYALIQATFALLLIFFFLSGWTRMRRRTIQNRTSFTSAMTTARVIQEMVDSTSAYLGTITLINLMLGLVVSGGLWLVGMPTPLMWGGIVALLNYIPYLGPITAALLLGVGGLMTFPDVWQAILPALVFIGVHLFEANLFTPTLVGRRLTINPLMILIALSYWGWVWGTTGALLAVPLLIILKTVLDAAGKPDIAGFLFEEGTLTSAPPEDILHPGGGISGAG